MELRRYGEHLLRANSSPLFSFLAPSVSAVWRPASSARAVQFPYKDKRSRRGFTSSASTGTEDVPQRTSSREAQPSKDLAGDVFRRKPRGNQTAPPPPETSPVRMDTNARINAKLDELFAFSAGSKSSPSSSDSATGVLGGLRAQSPLQERRGLRQGEIAGGMLMPGASGSTNSRMVAQSLIADNSVAARRNKRTVRSRPSVGRTIEVEPALGTDFGMAMKKLGVLMAVNRVRQDQKRQRFHERNGAKRKRLKGERWRTYFKAGFQATVNRVKRMRRQGW